MTYDEKRADGAREPDATGERGPLPPVRAGGTRDGAARGGGVPRPGGPERTGTDRDPGVGNPLPGAGSSPAVPRDSGRPPGPLRASSPDTAASTPGTPARSGGPDGTGTPEGLLAHGEREELARRLQQALNGFVDEPRQAVEEAAGVLDEATEHLTRSLSAHSRSLRADWDGAGRSDGAGTEDLRVALRAYREVTERLLRV